MAFVHQFQILGRQKKLTDVTWVRWSPWFDQLSLKKELCITKDCRSPSVPGGGDRHTEGRDLAEQTSPKPKNYKHISDYPLGSRGKVGNRERKEKKEKKKTFMAFHHMSVCGQMWICMHTCTYLSRPWGLCSLPSKSFSPPFLAAFP